jgi:hypothetical protein
MSIGNGEWKLRREAGRSPSASRRPSVTTGTRSPAAGIAEDGTNYSTDFDLICRRLDTGGVFTRPTR